MSSRSRLVIALVAFTLSLAFRGVGMAEESPAASSEATSSENGQQADSKPETANARVLVRKLGDSQFAEREAASRQLERLGAPAADALARAAQRGTAEVSRRAFSILEKHVHGDDAAASDAAKAALGQISKGNHAVAAERANQILKPSQPDRQPPLDPLLDLLPHLPNVGGANTTMLRINGLTRVTVSEGNGRKIKIVDDPVGGITVEVTEPKQADADEPVTKTYAAKDSAELKAKHPEAYQLYEQYVGQPRSNRGRRPGPPAGWPRGLFPPGQLDDVVPGFVEGFPNFDEDFMRLFKEGLPRELRELQKARPQRQPGIDGQDPQDVREQMEQQRRMMKELHRMLQRRRIPQPRAVPLEPPQPPAEKAPQGKPPVEPPEEPANENEGERPAEKENTVEV